jgi:regulator of replication initiation timing
MSDPKSSSSDNEPTSKVSQAAGARWPILPGESAEAYEKGLTSTIEELGAKTQLQLYLAEKIFQCLWWLRRYETQKRSTIVAGMADALTHYATPVELKLRVQHLINAGNWNHPELRKILEDKGYAASSLMQKAMDDKFQELNRLDQQIALRVKTLGQLQQSYEALVNRSIMQERLSLQNELMKRDLQALDVPLVEQVPHESNKTGTSSGHAKPKPKSR